MSKEILCTLLYLHLIASITIFAIIISNVSDPYKAKYPSVEVVKTVVHNQMQSPLKEIRISRGVTIFFNIIAF